MSRHSRASVFGPPPDLDAIVARAAGGDAAHADDVEGLTSERPMAESLGWDGGSAQLEDAQREAEVARRQAEHFEKQLKGAVAELELHKRHGREFKALLEQSEADLCAAHEHAADLQQRLQLAQEANRRNSDMAQQLLRHLNSTRVELKAAKSKNAQLQQRAAAFPTSEEDVLMLHDDAAGHDGPPTPDGAGRVDGSLPQGSSSGSAARTAATASPAAAGLGARASSQGGAAWQGDPPPVPLLSRLSTRAALTPVTHDVGVQADLLGARGAANTRIGAVARVALQHARELDREGAQRAVEAVNMEARPPAEGAPSTT